MQLNKSGFKRKPGEVWHRAGFKEKRFQVKTHLTCHALFMLEIVEKILTIHQIFCCSCSEGLKQLRDHLAGKPGDQTLLGEAGGDNMDCKLLTHSPSISFKVLRRRRRRSTRLRRWKTRGWREGRWISSELPLGQISKPSPSLSPFPPFYRSLSKSSSGNISFWSWLSLRQGWVSDQVAGFWWSQRRHLGAFGWDFLIWLLGFQPPIHIGHLWYSQGA